MYMPEQTVLSDSSAILKSVNDFTRDESPMVYKPAEENVANICYSVEIETIIRAIFNFKSI